MRHLGEPEGPSGTSRESAVRDLADEFQAAVPRLTRPEVERLVVIARRR